VSALEEDRPLPFDVAIVEPIRHEEEPMPTLTIGGTIRVPDLDGRWSVWSQSDETPGVFFVVPQDEAARSLGVKYAVIRAVMHRGSAEPTLTLVRTDPQLK
jgi:hypothetical protein